MKKYCEQCKTDVKTYTKKVNAGVLIKERLFNIINKKRYCKLCDSELKDRELKDQFLTRIRNKNKSL